jgi:hypothetical protein
VVFGSDVERLSRLWHSLLSRAPPENAQQLNSPQSSFMVRLWLYIFVFISSAAAGILAIVLNWEGSRPISFILILHDLVTFAVQQLLRVNNGVQDTLGKVSAVNVSP